MNRINVRRLFIVLEKAIARAARSTLFEFNDEFTRAAFVNLVEPYLRDVQGRRGIYEYRVVARDLDDDPISYKLEIAPPGMTIDSQSGILRWAPASGTTGTHHVRVVAQDGRGGFATQEFDLSFATASQPS